MLSRRGMMHGAAALGLGGVLHGGVAWSAPTAPVRMLLPSAAHDTLAIKLLLDRPPAGPPQLTIGGRAVPAERADPDGLAWRFVQRGLAPATRHPLTLADDRGTPLREPWSIRTLPAPGTTPDRMRILFFTCAGGDEEPGLFGFLPMSTRRALLDRALSFAPDLAVAIGDHVYWDQDTALIHRRDPVRRAAVAAPYRRIAWIDRDQAFDSATNRRSLATVVGRQIAALYEDRFASTPIVFVADDHDYFENDNAGPWGYAFPPRPFILNLHRRASAMAYPVALGRPKLAGGDHVSETIETVALGDLVELAIYECRRGNAVGPDSRVLFPAVEQYLRQRTRRSPARHLIQVPSNPFGYSAGKLGEWYADGPQNPSPLGDDKGYWRPGWFDQHQRLLQALASQDERSAVIVSGDLHATAATRITASGDLDLAASPVHAVLAGPISTGARGFPSAARGNLPFTPAALTTQALAPLEERNGFTIVDATADRLEIRQFRWRPPEPLAAIASLEPHATFAIERKS